MARILVLTGALLGLLTGCTDSGSSQPPPPSQPAVVAQPRPPRDELIGIWVMEWVEALGKKSPPEEAGGMKLEFRPNNVTWHFRQPDGWKSWDGELRYDSKSEPKQIDLFRPTNPDKVGLGIYKIEGNKLTISMGAERPKNWEEPSLAKMVLRRQ